MNRSESSARRVVLVAAMALAAAGAPAQAAVERVEIVERTAFAAGMSFGQSGPYEKIRAIAHFALDPAAAANARIVDLKFAPRDSRGRVTFASELIVLRPVKAGASTLIYDVNNRGSIAILGQLNGRSPAHNDPITAADAGDGFLMRHGFTLMFSAWTWDVAPAPTGARPLIFAPPIAKGPGGVAITGPVENEFIVNEVADVATYAGLRGLTYEPATPDDASALLTGRARPDGSAARRHSEEEPPLDPSPTRSRRRRGHRRVRPDDRGPPGQRVDRPGHQPRLTRDLRRRHRR